MNDVITVTSSASGPEGPLVAVPHRFTAAVVRRVVLLPGPGAYALGRDDGGFTVEYVGRSDHSVRDRLARHERLGDFDYFIVRYPRGSQSAYLLECAFWHASVDGGRQLENVIHPAAPRGFGLECPYCHFATHVRGLLAAQITEDHMTPKQGGRDVLVVTGQTADRRTR